MAVTRQLCGTQRDWPKRRRAAALHGGRSGGETGGVMFEDAARIVEGYFALRGHAGLELPDGWFGRPHDNLHELTLLVARPLRLLVELDDRLLLSFAGPVEVLEDAERLVLRSSRQIVLDGSLYGSDEPFAQTFARGDVVLHGPSPAELAGSSRESR